MTGWLRWAAGMCLAMAIVHHFNFDKFDTVLVAFGASILSSIKDSGGN